MAALLFTFLLAAFAPQESPASNTPSPQEQIELSLEQLVDAPTPSARKTLAASLARQNANAFDAWAQGMRDFGRFSAQPTDIRSETVDLQVLDKRESTVLWIYTPAKYDPTKPTPLMLAFHGTGDSGQGMHHMWRKLADEQGFLLLSPSEAGDNDGYHFSDRERAAALAALRWMRRHYNVDENHIYASGISRGGHLTWDLALRFPDQFAAIAPMIGSPRLTLVAGQNNMRLLENVAELSIRDLQGARDDPNLVDSVRMAFELLGRFAPRDAKLIEFAELGHAFDFDAVDWNTELPACKRDPWPDSVVRCTATKDEGRSYWLEITGLDKDVRETFKPKVQQNDWLKMDETARRKFFVAEAVERNARAHARRISPGVFSLKLDGATKVRLYLRAEDLEANAGALRITLNGKILERKAKPDLRTMLEDFAERFDRSAVVYSKVEIP
jgi:dienelactone hydrolase